MEESKKSKKSWKNLESELKIRAERLIPNMIYSMRLREIEIQYYYCSEVMDLIQFLHDNTKARELGSQHHAFKILFKYIIYQDEGKLEYSKDNKRVDIFIPRTNRIIEVKTMSDFTIEKLLKKTMAIKESEFVEANCIWFFYFLKVIDSEEVRNPCKNLLVFVAINSIDQDKKQLRNDLIMVVEESKQQVAKKLHKLPTLIIPVENIITVEDLERELKELKAEKDEKLKEKDEKLKEKDEKLKEKDDEIKLLKAKLKKFEKEK